MASGATMDSVELARHIRLGFRARASDMAVTDGRTVASFGDLNAYCEALDPTLTDLGAAAGARVGVVVRNGLSQFRAMAAVLALGRCLVVVNGLQSTERLRQDATNARVGALIAAPEDAEALLRTSNWDLPVGSTDGAIMSLGTARSEQNNAAGAVLDVPTSGTTGTPKRVCFSPMTAFLAAQNMADLSDEVERPARRGCPAVVVPYPLSSISGIVFLLHALVYQRALVLLEKFAVEAWRDAARRYPQALAYLPPAAIRMIVEAGLDRAAFEGVCIVRTGGAALDMPTREAFEGAYGVPIHSQYGATEYCGVVASTPIDRDLWKDKPDTVGRARHGVTLRVCDPDSGLELRPPATGILHVKVERVGGGWMPTNDLATIDEQGFLFIRGRADGAINRGGFKVLPELVAAALRGHPCVRDAEVVGIPDERLGEVPVAAVELRPGARPVDAGELAAFARGKLLPYQVPVRFELLPELPRTVTLKPDRAAIRALFLSR